MRNPLQYAGYFAHASAQLRSVVLRTRLPSLPYSIAPQDDLQSHSRLSTRFRETHAHAIPGAIGNAGNLGDAERWRLEARIVPGRQILSSRVKISIFDSSSSGTGLDDQVGLAGGVFDTAGKFQPGKCGIGGGGRKPARLHRPVELACGIRSPPGAERWAKDLPEWCDSRPGPPPCAMPRPTWPAPITAMVRTTGRADYDCPFPVVPGQS